MADYIIQVKLITESIFGSGHSIPGSVDLEVVYDEIGLPFMKAKTFKGNFRESMGEIAGALKDKYYSNIVDELLGKENEGVRQWERLKFSDMRLSSNVRLALERAVSNKKLDKEEIKYALTEVRSFTSVDADGSYKEGSLRHIRVIKKDLTFEVELHSELDLSTEKLGMLAMTARNLRHIGTMRTRGKGEVDCSLLVKQNGKYMDKTDCYIETFCKVVKAYV